MRDFIVRLLQLPIRFYKIIISPILPKSCIYTPTCSTYFLRSLELYGPVKGSIFGFLRILRCNPFFMGGYDSIDDKTYLRKELSKFKVFRRRC